MTDSIFKIENISALLDVIFILVKVVPLYSSGHGSSNITTTSFFMTNSRHSIIGLSNEVLFITESCAVSE